MSVITYPEVTPNRMRSIYNWLLINNHEEEVETLKKLLVPSIYDIVEEGKSRRDQFVNPNIRELIEIGILTENGDKIRFSEKLISWMGRDNVSFQTVFTKFLFGEKPERNYDFIMGLAWILSIDPFDAPSDWTSFERKIKEDNIQDVTGISNDARYGNFRLWSNFLGFSWNYQRFVPDPTQQILWQLPYIFPQKENFTISSFLVLLNEKIPVLDGGSYRNQVLSLKKQQQEPHLISTAFSLALMRLQEKGVLTLEKKSDTESMLLSNEFGSLSISHIRLN